MIEELAPGIFTVPQRVAEGRNGAIVGAHGALAIDSGNDATEGGALVTLIRAYGRRPDRLALTHGHGDHILGSGAFAGADILAHALTPGVIREELARVALRLGRPPEELAAAIGWPTRAVADGDALDLGGRTVRFIETPGHSPDGLSLYVEEARVLFAGDTVVTGIVPAIGQGDSRQLERSLARLAALDIAILVAGHGPPLRGPAAVADWLAWARGYLGAVRAHAQAGLARGDTPDAIAAAADYDRFIGDRLPRDRHGMPARHRNTVLKIVEEVGGRQ